MHYHLLYNGGSFRTRNKDQKAKKGGSWEMGKMSLFPHLRLAVHRAIFDDENQ